MTDYILLYIAAVSLISVIVCIYDKKAAIGDKRRISEKSLFTLSFLGGSLAMYITMRVIRHKTLHKSFMIGLPLIIIFHIILLYLLIDKSII